MKPRSTLTKPDVFEHRSEYITTRITPTEHVMLKAFARANELGVSAVLHLLCMAIVGYMKKASPSPDELVVELVEACKPKHSPKVAPSCELRPRVEQAPVEVLIAAHRPMDNDAFDEDPVVAARGLVAKLAASQKAPVVEQERPEDEASTGDRSPVPPPRKRIGFEQPQRPQRRDPDKDFDGTNGFPKK